ncbi:dTDP-glucose 4,6-dehydratase [Allorhodopirellula heiligendammensis]|uniref:dTDP-glucose 4,6-dehydratase n=1 Tax=Allorhodopirellula heiligendammensis TaxID=2714739 RepID=A0A5C6C276_9BACT|nr:dTDP-glucose 4,6-dehydratase [Allorhodopirellula heiligendammensis]TWU18097.1 dTDP-glucose 4,6-dehydratase 2 [Allorhodopirellula heiligendammensis]
MAHPKRLLITGGAGFIGSNLVRLALLQGHEVLNIDSLTYAGNVGSLRDVQSNSRYQFARIDITDAESINQTLRDYAPDAVMHLAAESHVDRSIDGPGQFIQTNVIGTFNLLQASLQHYRNLPPENADHFRFLHVSTDEVYGSLGESGLFTEASPYDPHSPYSASKASSDHLARAWADTYGLPVLVTNCSNNYGPYQFPEKLIPVVILKCLRGEPIPVYGLGENIRDWLYVEDHCQALLAVVEKGRPGQTYNIGGNNELRNIDLVRSLCEIMDELKPMTMCASQVESGSASEANSGYSQLITFVTDRPGHDARYAIDARKISEELNWQPQQNKQSGFRKTVQWYLDNQAWWQDILSGDYQLDRLGRGARSA